MEPSTPEVGSPGRVDDQSGSRMVASTRSVLHYTPTQLYRKRAFDRRNQRECRARKEGRIKSLEEENRELKSRITALQSDLREMTTERDGLQEQSRNGPRLWQVLPVAIPAVTRLDHIMHHFRTRKLPGLFQIPMQEIARAKFPSITSLLNGKFTQDTPVASIVGEHGPWMQITSSAARTAVQYNLCLYFRWLLSPTEVNYLSLPVHLRPTILQMTTPHPMWIDIMPWPQGRDQLIKNMHWEAEQERFRLLHNETLSVNWPYPLADILVTDSNNDIALNPLFEAHIRRIESYTIGKKLIDTFPYMDSIPTHIVSQGD
ncbi:hypothetical protein CLAIMM_01193 [Cladophialophora immunda]|nr:hypothetical protein CLAIMM_01193 [Cladophialophora immunda]